MVDPLSLQIPAELTPELDAVLGLMNFETGPIAHLFQTTGVDIPRKVEREQAFVLHWLLTLAAKHRADWRLHAGAEIARRLDLLKNAEAARG